MLVVNLEKTVDFPEAHDATLRAYSALCDLLRVDFSMAFRAELDEKTD